MQRIELCGSRGKFWLESGSRPYTVKSGMMCFPKSNQSSWSADILCLLRWINGQRRDTSIDPVAVLLDGLPKSYHRFVRKAEVLWLKERFEELAGIDMIDLSDESHQRVE